MPLTRHASLAGLLGELFDPDALRRFFRRHEPFAELDDSLPGLGASRAALNDAAASELISHGLTTAELFSTLAAERPRRIREIEAVAREFDVVLEDAPSGELSAPETYRRSIGLLRVDEVHGCTAWLVAPDLAVTGREALARLPAGFPLVFELDDATTGVQRVDVDPDSECALLELKSPLSGRPLPPIAGRCAGRVAGWTIGYSRARRGWAVPLDELLVFSSTGGEARTAHSETLSVHMDRPHHCLGGAPIFVEGHVVAFVDRRIEREDEPGRSLSALIQTCPSSQILARLRRSPDRLEVGHNAGTIAPTIADDQIHTFVAFAGADLEWARSLEQRLTLEGFRAFLGEPGPPGATRGGPLAEALSRSRSAIVLLSRAWASSPACDLIGTMLLQRRRQDLEFRLVVIRLDDVPLTPPWDQCRIEDFRRARSPYGPRWDDLAHALVWRAAPSPATQLGAKEAADTHATDVMEADLWAAARAGATEVMSLWRGWRSAGVLTRAPSLRSAEYLISQARADLALEILEAIDDNIRAQQLRALAYSRTGQEEASLKLLEKLRKSGAADAETMGLLAGRCKRLWAADGRRLWLEKAHELYGAAFERFGESYTGINAAALALYLGQRERSQRLARDVLAVLTDQPERSLDHWKLATMAEAWHLLGDVEKAAARYTEAVRMCPEFYSDIASMRTQARRNAHYLGGDENLFDDILAIPRVVAFIGHMEDLPERGNPRFPPALAAPLREAIRARLRDLSAGFGFCSLARGADILFVEEMLARRSQLKAFLPFPAAEFEKTSVGPRWAPRFRELLAEPRVEVRVLASAMPPEDERAAAYYACSTAFFRRAIDFAQSLGEKPVLLAVWDGRPGDAAGGTADGVMFWQQTGNAVSVIDIAALRSAHGV